MRDAHRLRERFFLGVHWGPFFTPYHRRRVTDELRSRFAAFVAERFEDEFSIPVEQVDAAVRTVYLEEGMEDGPPHYRDLYEFKCIVSAGTRREYLRMTFRIEPPREEFRIEGDPKVLSEEELKISREQDRIVRELDEKRPPPGVVPGVSCPRCGGAVERGAGPCVETRCRDKGCFSVFSTFLDSDDAQAAP